MRVGSTNSPGEKVAVQRVSLLSVRYLADCCPIKAGGPMAGLAELPSLGRCPLRPLHSAGMSTSEPVPICHAPDLIKVTPQ